MLPSSAELNYFIEISNTLNLSRASEKLGISQPSLSLALKRLEHSVGTELFIRHKHGVTLTQAGKQLLLHSKQMLQLWEETRAKTLASHQEIQGYFTLGCHSTIAMHIVTGFLADLLEKNPKLEIQLKHNLSRVLLEDIINLAIDIGIIANPIHHPDLIIRKLCDDEVSFWTGNGKRKIQNFHSEQAVIIGDSHLTQTQFLLKKIKKAGMNYQRIVNTNSLEVVAHLTASGCGIGILPARVAKMMYPNKLKRIANAPAYNDELCLVYRHENRNIQAIQTIITAIKDFFQ